ncbi:hypothetical protein [Mucilaginibacter sp. dw_454]|uniref:hypothetical protein n=1 Tax=Mucilaginibacter sp. dw_454 TaxID=2720079 RepID=UPI001BD437E3|nr:hypothetical protein [Mucilaginibacter sp. dw_454]
MKNRSYLSLSKFTLVVSISLYAVSLTQQGYCVSGFCGDHWSGLSLVAMGAIGGIMSIAGLTWYANPALWAAWSQISRHPKRSFIFSLIGTLLAASFLLATEISDIKPNVQSNITGYQPGYWLWLASMAVMLTGSMICYIFNKNNPPADQLSAYLRVDFNKRYAKGVTLQTKGSLYQNNDRSIKLHEGMEAILWDIDYDDKKRDDLAVKAVIRFSSTQNSWVAEFNLDDLLHESQREKPLLYN